MQWHPAQGNAAHAKHVAEVIKRAVDDLDRFEALTPEAQQSIKDNIDNALKE